VGKILVCPIIFWNHGFNKRVLLWHSVGEAAGANEKLSTSAAASVFIMKMPRKFVLWMRNQNNKGTELWPYILFHWLQLSPRLFSSHFVSLIRISFILSRFVRLRFH
jgi:hypothetical protein